MPQIKTKIKLTSLNFRTFKQAMSLLKLTGLWWFFFFITQLLFFIIKGTFLFIFKQQRKKASTHLKKLIRYS